MKLRYLLLATLLLLWAHPASSQGCAMCYSSAAGLSHDGQHAINRAVLVLLLPPGTFMTLGLALAYRYSKKRDREELRLPPTGVRPPVSLGPHDLPRGRSRHAIRTTSVTRYQQ
jgi:hypothetical protein